MSTSAFVNPFAPQNPFFTSNEDTMVDAVEAVDDGREVSYALVQSGPKVAAEEVESHLDVVEVKVTWGTQVLALEHLESGRGFSIGEGGTFVLPDLDKTMVVESRLGVTYAIVPVDGAATVSAKGEAVRAAGAGEEIALAEGMTVRIEVASVTIEIGSVRAGKKIPLGFLATLASGAAACIGLSFVGHAAIVASMAMFMPAMNADDAENISRDQILKMQALMDASADREHDKQIEEAQAGPQESTGGGSKGGEPHAGAQGLAGTQKSANAQGRIAFRGADERDAVARRQAEIAEAKFGGLVGILNSSMPVEGPASPWATDEHKGTDSQNALGHLWGADINDAFGSGLGFLGDGEGGGGKGAGIGLNGFGDLVGGGGNGTGKWGVGNGDKDGLGNGHGRVPGSHVTRAPIIRTPDTTVNGTLPAEVIQRIVRQNFGRFRLCYEAGLRNNPALQGRVTTKFVIGRDGAVAQAADGGSDLPNQEVVSCVVRSFTSLSFPSPEKGIVTVSYPIILQPGDS